MSHSPPPTVATIEHQASLWVIRIDNCALSTKEHAEFMAWIKAKPEHKLAFERLARWQISINQLPELTANKIAAEEPQIPVNTRSFKVMTSFKALSTAAALIGLVVISLLITQPHAPQTNALLAYQTAMGEQKKIALPDGSTVTLNTDSAIEIHFNKQLRAIELTRGEAYFEVFKDPTRPFEVTRLDKIIRAVGTAFTVHAQKHLATEVMVTEGRVELTQISAPHNTNTPQKTQRKTIAFIDQGQLATMDAHDTINVTSITAENTQQRLAWRQAMVMFNGEPLAHAIAEISRYSGTRFIIESPALANKRIGGYFKANDIDAFISALSLQFNINAHTDSHGTIVLSEH